MKSVYSIRPLTPQYVSLFLIAGNFFLIQKLLMEASVFVIKEGNRKAKDTAGQLFSGPDPSRQWEHTFRQPPPAPRLRNKAPCFMWARGAPVFPAGSRGSGA